MAVTSSILKATYIPCRTFGAGTPLASGGGLSLANARNTPMFSLANQIERRKILMTLAGVLVGFYAVWVLWYVHSTPDVGLRTAFNPEIRTVEANAVLHEKGRSELPQAGDQIVSVNGRPVRTWPDLLQAVRDLGHQSPVPVTQLPEASDGWLGFIHLNDTDLVLVRFVHLKSGQTDAL